MTSIMILIADPAFTKQARAFAKWYRLQRTAALEAGKIAAEWLEHYSRERNAERLADALHAVTGVRVTARTLRNYRDIYLTADMYRRRSRRSKCGNDFHSSHVGPTHLLAVARAKLPDATKVRILNEVEREKMTVLRTKARLAQLVIETERAKQPVKCLRSGPRGQGRCHRRGEDAAGSFHPPLDVRLAMGQFGRLARSDDGWAGTLSRGSGRSSLPVSQGASATIA